MGFPKNWRVTSDGIIDPNGRLLVWTDAHTPLYMHNDIKGLIEAIPLFVAIAKCKDAVRRYEDGAIGFSTLIAELGDHGYNDESAMAHYSVFVPRLESMAMKIIRGEP